MTTKTLMKLIADLLPNQGETLNWVIRGEIGDDDIDENKNMIAVVHCASQEEIIYNNFTFKLSCALTGQVLLNALTPEQIHDETTALYKALVSLIGSLKYTELGDSTVLEGTVGVLETDTNELYWNFSVPFTLYVQF